MSTVGSTCRACGANLVPGDQFCSHCGTTHTGPPTTETVPLPVVAAPNLLPAPSNVPLVPSPVHAPPLHPIPAQPSPPAPAWPAHSVAVPSYPRAAGPTVVFAPQRGQLPFFVRALWYVFIGWWLAGFVIVLGYLAMITLVGIPLAFFMFNRIPQALTLRARTTTYRVEARDGVTYVSEGAHPQHPWLLRAVYFLAVGWWFGAIWLSLAWLIGLLVITLPISIWMYNRTSAVITFQRH